MHAAAVTATSFLGLNLKKNRIYSGEGIYACEGALFF